MNYAIESYISLSLDAKECVKANFFSLYFSYALPPQKKTLKE